MWCLPTSLTSLSQLTGTNSGLHGAQRLRGRKFSRAPKTQKHLRRRGGRPGKLPGSGPRRPRAICCRSPLHSCSCGNSHADAPLLAVISCSWGLSAAQAEDLELAIVLPQPRRCWNHRRLLGPLGLLYFVAVEEVSLVAQASLKLLTLLLYFLNARLAWTALALCGDWEGGQGCHAR